MRCSSSVEVLFMDGIAGMLMLADVPILRLRPRPIVIMLIVSMMLALPISNGKLVIVKIFHILLPRTAGLALHSDKQVIPPRVSR